MNLPYRIAGGEPPSGWPSFEQRMNACPLVRPLHHVHPAIRLAVVDGGVLFCYSTSSHPKAPFTADEIDRRMRRARWRELRYYNGGTHEGRVRAAETRAGDLVARRGSG